MGMGSVGGAENVELDSGDGHMPWEHTRPQNCMLKAGCCGV